MRGATLRPADCSARTRHFNPRAPCGARHLLVGRALCVCLDFNPRAPCGARRHLIPRVYEDSHFNPRAPCGARHEGAKKMLTENIFQSTRPMRGATLFPSSCRKWGNISIHAPHAGRDSKIVVSISTITNFNPRAPCGARPGRSGGFGSDGRISIHAPHAGRDYMKRQMIIIVCYFNPRAPCGARRWISENQAESVYISIHAPHAGRDDVMSVEDVRNHAFQSTRPMRGATSLTRWRRSWANYFNPRAPCGARPQLRGRTSQTAENFNPRAPCGARQQK